MPANYPTVDWNPSVAAAASELIRLARAEDLPDGIDWTTAAIVGAKQRGAATVVSRAAGVIAGLPIGPLVIQEFDADAEWTPIAEDGDAIAPGQAVARLRGDAGDVLTCERTILNFLGRLSGIASLTREFVKRTESTGAKVYDTRKTTPGWRLLEKYAVRCGGGSNHRLGLSGAILIKDNHLALSGAAGLSLADAVRQARAYASEQSGASGVVIEVEVDTLDQLRAVLPAAPDIVLLDNMTPGELRSAVQIRENQVPGVVLEASGGVRLETIGEMGGSGVDRISVGALTHSATSLDLGLDWGV